MIAHISSTAVDVEKKTSGSSAGLQAIFQKVSYHTSVLFTALNATGEKELPQSSSFAFMKT